MDKRSKILISLFVLLVIGVSVWKYKVFIIDRDFVVYDNISCDPYTESCFAYVCEEGDKECDDTPFKKIEKNAQFIDVCDIAGGEKCPELSCGLEEEGCVITTCSEDNVEDGERCVIVDSLPEVITSSPDASLDGIASSTTDVSTP